MRNLKKFLALVLAMMMAFSLMVTANAATSSKDLNLSDSDTVTAAFLEDIQVLTGMEVIKGYPDGSFKPTTTINRHQMATFIYRMTTGDTSNMKDLYLSQIAAEKFPDVKAEDDYAGYIGYCYVNGYIAGFPDGTFKPMNKVTGYQALVMILRAMGYNNPTDNFTGSDWQSLAASRARMNNLLVNIDTTTYNNTFSRPATRELVAEMVFQGLIQPQVTYTTAFGYQKYGMEGGVLSSILNPTLGFEFYGLTHNKGVIVGNGATGEPNIADGTETGAPATKIGFSLDAKALKSLNDFPSSIGDDTVVGLVQTGLEAVINDDVNSATSKAYVYSSDDEQDVAENVTMAFKWESNLKQFGHAVDVWYDCRSNDTVTVGASKSTGQVKFPTNLNTYAVFDRVVDTKVVNADNPLLGDDSADTTSLGEKLGYAGNAFWNYAFGPTKYPSLTNNGASVPVSYDTAATERPGTTADTANFTSPIQANNGDADHDDGTVNNNEDYQLYLVISNTGDKTPDLIVSLNVTFSVVSQDNNTTAPLSTGIVTENGAGTDYFDLFDQINPAIGDDYSNIANANLLDSDDIALRDKVAAVTITGTARTTNYGGTTAAVEDNNGNAPKIDTIGTTDGKDDNSSYYYQMKIVKETVSGYVNEYNLTNQDVYLQGRAEPLHQSVFALAVDGSFKSRDQVNAPHIYGDYTFYLDENGDYLWWEIGKPTAEFVYGTYIDYASQTASSTFVYPFVYVNDQGEGKQVKNVSSIDTHVIDSVYYNDDIVLPKRTFTGGNSAGFFAGKYVGYALDGTSLTHIPDDTTLDTGFVQAGAGDVKGDSVVTDDFNSANTTIDSTAVNIGAINVGSAANLFLTNETKFVIVNGAGTDNQTVDIRTGLAALIGEGNDSVEIQSHTHTASAADLTYLTREANETNPYEMIYYSMKPFQYSQTYDPSAYAVDTVYIPVQLLSWTASSTPGNLFFMGDNTHGVVNTDGNFATKYTFYQGGVESKLWIDGHPDGEWGDITTAATGSTATIEAINTDNVFYRLRDTGKKAHDNQPIYSIEAVDDSTPTDIADKIIIGKYYDGTTTAAETTRKSWTLGTDSYLATTYSAQVAYIGGRTSADLFNVATAGVKNLNKAYTINSLGDLNNASSLDSNTGVAVSCVLGDNANTIGFIYVNF